MKQPLNNITEPPYLTNLDLQDEENNTNENLLNHSSTSSKSSYSSAEKEEITEEMKERLDFKKYLYDKLQEVIATREQYPIISEFKSKNCTVRRRPMSGVVDLFILERVDYGVSPEPFVHMQRDVRDFLSANKLCMGVDMLH